MQWDHYRTYVESRRLKSFPTKKWTELNPPSRKAKSCTRLITGGVVENIQPIQVTSAPSPSLLLCLNKPFNTCSLYIHLSIVLHNSYILAWEEKRLCPPELSPCCSPWPPPPHLLHSPPPLKSPPPLNPPTPPPSQWRWVGGICGTDHRSSPESFELDCNQFGFVVVMMID